MQVLEELLVPPTGAAVVERLRCGPFLTFHSFRLKFLIEIAVNHVMWVCGEHPEMEYGVSGMCGCLGVWQVPRRS
jgi:hypothetical protein